MDLSTSQRVKNLINSAIEGNINYLIKINESTLASANDNQTIKIWNLGSGNSCIKTFNYEVDHKICCLLKFNDSKLISAGLSIKIWDLNTSKFIKELNTLTTLQFEIKIIFKLNNTKIAYILNDRLYIWDILNDECINTKHSAVCFIELNKFQFAIVSKVNNFIEILKRETLKCMYSVDGKLGENKIVKLIRINNNQISVCNFTTIQVIDCFNVNNLVAD